MEEKRDYAQEFMAAFNKGMGFTWLQNHGHNLKKDELIDIAKELIYAIEDTDLLDIDKKDIISKFNENMDYEPNTEDE